MALLTYSSSLVLKSYTRQITRAFICTSSVCASHGGKDGGYSGKLYELRTYAIKPDRFGDFNKIMQEGYALRTAHSKLIGYWSTDLGGVNEVVHIWEYDSYAHRTAVRKALAQDENWVGKCFSKILPMFASQTNVITRAFPWCSLQLEPSKSGTAPGVFGLVDYRVKPGLVPQLEHRLLQNFSELGYDPLGMFYTVYGDVNRVYSLVRYNSLDEWEESLAKAQKNDVIKETFRDINKYLDGVVVKAMSPAPFSPLQ